MTSLTPKDHEAVRQLAEKQWTEAVLARDWGKVLEMCTDDVVAGIPEPATGEEAP